MVSPRQSPPLAISAQADKNIESVVAEIERMCVTLRAEPNYSTDFAAKGIKSNLFVAINAHPHPPTEWLKQAATPN
jgi:hypothetical protein